MQIGLGTAALGRPQYINIRDQNVDQPFDMVKFKQAGLDVLDHAYNSGIRYFDTAPGYGIAEDLVANWVKTKADQHISLGTKWGYTYVANYNPAAEVHEIKEHSISKLKEQWHKSKTLLPFLKYYQIHSATLESGVLDNEKVLRELVQIKHDFKIKIGLTASGSNQASLIRRALDVNNEWDNLFDVFQVTFNMLDQSILKIKELIYPTNYTLIIKEVLANGRIFRNKRYPHYAPLYTTLEKLATLHSVGVDAIALRFAMQSFPSSIVLSGGSTKAHLTQNLKALKISLSDLEMKAIRNHIQSPSDYWDERKKLGWS